MKRIHIIFKYFSYFYLTKKLLKFVKYLLGFIRNLSENRITKSNSW